MKPTSTMPAQPQTTEQLSESSFELLERIRRGAYEMYEERGRQDGHDLEDWLTAESELNPKKAKTVGA